MAKILHSLDILNTMSYIKLSHLEGLSNIHLASILVQELSQDIKDRKKDAAFLEFLKKEPKLAYVYNRIFFQSKFLYTLIIIHLTSLISFIVKQNKNKIYNY